MKQELEVIPAKQTVDEFMKTYPFTEEQLAEQFRAGRDKIQQTAEVSEEAKANLRAYWDKVLSLPENPQPKTVARQFKRVMSYEDGNQLQSAKHLVYKQFLEEQKKQKSKRTFELNFSNGNYSEVLRTLIKYFINDPNSPIKPDDWVYLYGNVGCGKSLLMDTMRKFCIDDNNQKMFVKIDAPAIPSTIKATPDTINMMTCYDVCFDDAGYKMAEILYENKNINPLEFILWKRYAKWEAARQLTYFTSNLPLELFLSAFDERLQDRIRSCTTEIKLTGNSLR